MAAPRLCSACRTTRLSRFNAGTVCGSCARAARDLERVTPTWLWDSQPMRRALARVDPGAALALFRTVSGLSQQDVADLMGWSQSTVSLIEKGQRETLFDIRELLRFADMVEMPREALAPVLVGEPDAALGERALDQPGAEEGEDVDRRSFGNIAAGAVAAAMLPKVSVPSRVTAAHVRYLRTCADSLYGREQAIGGAGVLKQALRQWHRARRMLDEAVYTEQVGRELIGAVGDLAVRAGWASYDSGDQTGLARQLYAEALLLADQAEDNALAVHALASMSLQSVQLARDSRPGLAREAVRLSARAAELAHRDPAPRLHALIAAREAIAHAALGDAHGFRTAITRAWRELDRGPAPEDPLWLRFVVPAEIGVHEAKGLTYLGNPRAAVEVYRTSMEDASLSHRNRACYHSQLAATLARCGDITGALSEGLAVLPSLEGPVASLRTLRELRPVRSAAEQAGEEEFCARFDAAARMLAA
jgi:transcriptional regulator with XRE-family HTH domain